MGMNLTLTNIDKYLKQYFSTKAYKILYLMCGLLTSIPKHLYFAFYDFFMIYYAFSKFTAT